MNLLEISNLVNFVIADRKPELPSLTPKRFSDLLNIAQLKHYKRKIGLPEEYQVGMPLPRQAYDVTQKITEDLSIFKVFKDGNNAIQFVSGKCNYPADYYYPSGMAAVIDVYGNGTMLKNVIFVTDNRWFKMNGNYVDKPSDEYPVANFQSDHIRIAPSTIKRAVFSYLRLPKKAVFGVTTSGKVNTYNAASSVQLEWDDVNQMDIIFILLSDLGIIMQRQDIYQISEKHKQQGI